MPFSSSVSAPDLAEESRLRVLEGGGVGGGGEGGLRVGDNWSRSIDPIISTSVFNSE